ncbi:MAG: hypothetical protein ACYC5G_04290 [Candidatus Doudnabacteria bacterium]
MSRKITPEPEIPVIGGSQPPTHMPVYVKAENLKTKQTSLIHLTDPKFCAKEAERIFNWFQQNLPYGVYQQLYRLMEDRQKFLEKN